MRLLLLVVTVLLVLPAGSHREVPLPADGDLLLGCVIYEYEPFAHPSELMASADITVVGDVVSVDSANIGDDLEGQGAAIVGLRPTEWWRDDPDRTGDTVYFALQRPKNFDAEIYRYALPLGTRVVLFGHDMHQTFTEGDPGATVYDPGPQGLLIDYTFDRSVKVCSAVDVAASEWPEIKSVDDLRAALGT